MTTIFVSTAHIRNGEPKDCTQCPVALALFDAGYCVVSVRGDFIAVDGMTFTTPDIVHDFINIFDMYNVAEPFSFELPL
jgi:uncharacterized Zn-binding protein involved in type VI secretion